MRIGKWVPIAGAFARILLLGFFMISAVVHGVRNGVQPLSGADFVPTWVGFVALVPVLIFNYVGFELPSTATEEMTDPQRTVPFAILRVGRAGDLDDVHQLPADVPVDAGAVLAACPAWRARSARLSLF